MKNIIILLIFIAACTVENRIDRANYSLFSPSTVALTVLNDPADSLLIKALVFTNIPKDANESNILSLSKAGNYYLNIEVDRPTKSFLTIGKREYNIFLFPNDTTHIEIIRAIDEPELSFEGAAKSINEYYLSKKNKLGYSDIRLSFNKALGVAATYNAVKKATDSVSNQESLFLKNYANLAQLPEWFLDYENAEIIYSGAGFKTTLPHYNEIFKVFHDVLPADYFDYLSQVEIDNAEAILSTYYFWFLDDYFARNLPVREFNELKGFARVSKFTSFSLTQSKTALSGVTKELYHKSKLSALIKFYSDSIAIDSIARQFELSDYQDLIRISGTRSKGDIQMSGLSKGDTIPDFFTTDNLDSLISIRDFQDKIIYLNFWATWCGPCLQNIPALNGLIVKYKGDSRIRFMNICIESEKDKWLSTIRNYNLLGTNLFAEGNWNAKIKAYFDVKGIPHYAIIKEGNVLFENFTDSAPKVQSKIEKLLDDKVAIK